MRRSSPRAPPRTYEAVDERSRIIKVSGKEMYNRIYEIDHDLGRWLWEKSDQSVQERFNVIGERRCEEGIPLAEVLWALTLTKDRLLEYLGAYALANSAVELYQQQELDRLIGNFFDRAVDVFV